MTISLASDCVVRRASCVVRLNAKRITQNAQRKRAFTFIELLVIVAILATLAGLAAPRVRRSLEDLELDNFAKDIYYLTRYLQGAAIGSGKVYRLNIDRAKNDFIAVCKDNPDEEFKPLAGRFGKAYQAPSGASVSLEPPDKTQVLFFPDGSIDKPIEIKLANKNNKQVSLLLKGVSGAIKTR